MSLRLTAFLACLTVPLASAANVAVEFDFGAGLGTFSGSEGTMQYYLDGQQAGTGVGVTISGWQARATDRNFRNRTDKLDADTSTGFGLDFREQGAEEGIDNFGRYDLIIFEFEELVSLDRVDMGWMDDDYDISVLAHTGAGDPTLDNRTFRYEEGHNKSMTSLGWELVGHYGENAGANVDVNTTSIVSTFWAIGAYTSAIVDASRTYGAPDHGNDAFTLRSLAANVMSGAQQIAEPGGLALLGIGLLALLRRRAHA